jgi:hypothetical protein
MRIEHVLVFLVLLTGCGLLLIMNSMSKIEKILDHIQKIYAGLGVNNKNNNPT